MKPINAAGSALTPYLTLIALTQSGMQWVMHPAQHVSLERLELLNQVEVTRTVTGGGEKFSVQATPNTLCGIPYLIDDSLDPGRIELRQGGRTIARIDNLAIPAFADV